MPKPKDTGSNLALPDAAGGGLAVLDANALATQSVDALAGIEGIEEIEITDDGLGELSGEDIKLPVKIWNAKTLDAEGNPILPNVFFDTVTEQTQKQLDVIFIKVHKTNEWREYDDAQGKSVVRCSSFDQVTGVMDDGLERKCEGCNDAKWDTVIRDDGSKKRTRRCGPVQNVFAVELPEMKPCLVRFRRSSLTPIQTYWTRYHIKQRPVRDPKNPKRVIKVNYPAYAFAARVTLKMSDDRKYAIPVIDQTARLPKELFMQALETVSYVDAVLLDRLPKVADVEVAATVDDDSFDTSKMGGGGGNGSSNDSGMGGGAGQDFVDSPPAE